MNKCLNCRYWTHTDQICRRYPTITFHGGDDWCGEYKAVEVPAIPVLSAFDASKRPNEAYGKAKRR